MTVSVMIFTLNEERHLPRCLGSLRWSDDVIVVDSYSSDRSREIAQAAGARFVQQRFSTMWEQRNWALEHAGAKHEWVLILDADERVPPELGRELLDVSRNAPAALAAYRVRRRLYMWGRWLRHSSLYPTWIVRLVQRHRVRYFGRGHGEGEHVDGEIRDLQHDLIDENLGGIEAWFARQNAYSTRDAQHELETEKRGVGFGGLLARDPAARRLALKALAARVPGRALAYFLYSYVWRRGFLDGRDGLVYCTMKAVYQQMVNIKKHDYRRRQVQPIQK
jgi:glycosyltransferase involved in cell wall biosynthesis